MPLATARPVAAIRRLLTEELARGTLFNLVFMGVNTVLALAAAILAGRYLGPEGVGILGLAFVVIEFVSIVDNLPTAGYMRDYSQAPTREKLATVLALRGTLGLLTALVIAAASPLLALALRIPASVLLVFALIPLTSILSSVAIMTWEARRNPLRRNLPSTVESATKVALFLGVLFIASLPGDPVVQIAAATVAASFAGTLAGILLVPNLSLAAFRWGLAVDYLRFGVPTQFTGVLNKVIAWIDILLIDLITLNHALTGLYRTAYTVMAFVPMFVGSVNILLFPAVSELAGRGDRAGIQRLLARALAYGFLIAVPLVLLVVVLAEPILSVFGPEFAEGAWMLRALALTSLLAAAVSPFEVLFPALNHPRLSLRIVAVEVVVNVGLDLVLIPLYGVLGAIIATAVAFATGLAVALLGLRTLGYEMPRPAHLRTPSERL